MMYESQINSKKNRNLIQILNRVFIPDEVYDERYKKYYKTHYNGKPTKRYLKYLKRTEISESYPIGTLESLMMM